MLSPENTIIQRRFMIRSLGLQQLIFKRDLNELDKKLLSTRCTETEHQIDYESDPMFKMMNSVKTAKGREKGATLQVIFHSTCDEDCIEQQ